MSPEYWHHCSLSCPVSRAAFQLLPIWNDDEGEESWLTANLYRRNTVTFVTKPCVYAGSVSDLSNDKKSGRNKLGNASFLNLIHTYYNQVSKASSFPFSSNDLRPSQGSHRKIMKKRGKNIPLDGRVNRKISSLDFYWLNKEDFIFYISHIVLIQFIFQ